eukprot:6130782-Amphidinium_carterae.1
MSTQLQTSTAKFQRRLKVTPPRPTLQISGSLLFRGAHVQRECFLAPSLDLALCCSLFHSTWAVCSQELSVAGHAFLAQ